MFGFKKKKISEVIKKAGEKALEDKESKAEQVYFELTGKHKSEVKK